MTQRIISMCRFMWRLRWSLRLNDLSQNLQWNGLSPVCFLKCNVNIASLSPPHLMCLLSSSDRENFQPQSFQPPL